MTGLHKKHGIARRVIAAGSMWVTRTHGEERTDTEWKEFYDCNNIAF